MDKAPIDKCHHCGNDGQYYIKEQVRGSVASMFRFDGEDPDNTELYSHLSHKSGKYAYCKECDKRLFKVRD
ncbi:hypothetical protein [Amphibacillus jilinensis]|uniref:hypothetical protein n=1 Tax=Amphibacillus jilinensis TaxID=1216008 RepID=UPI0003758EAE|nr:hypothetical protein [Amphibacillus jilinensis]